MLVFFFLLLKFSIWGIKFRLLKFHEDFYSRVVNNAIFIIAKSAKLSTNKVLKKLTYPSVTIVDNDTYEDYKRTRILP